MFLKSSRRTASIKTQFYCDLFYITREDMEKLTYNFDQDMEKFMEIGQKRYESS